MGVINQIVFDCENPAALAKFWAQVLEGYHLREYDQLKTRKNWLAEPAAAIVAV